MQDMSMRVEIHSVFFRFRRRRSAHYARLTSPPSPLSPLSSPISAKYWPKSKLRLVSLTSVPKSKSPSNMPVSDIRSVEANERGFESFDSDGTDVGAVDNVGSVLWLGVGFDVDAPGGEGVMTEMGLLAGASGGTETVGMLGDGWTDLVVGLD